MTKYLYILILIFTFGCSNPRLMTKKKYNEWLIENYKYDYIENYESLNRGKNE